MRVLWFTNVPLKALLEHWGRTATGSGFWMHSLVDPLKDSQAVSRLGVVCAGVDFPSENVELDGVDYYSVGQSRPATQEYNDD